MKNKALFLDRDGIILKMVYDLENGYIHTALHPRHVQLVEGAISLLKKAKKLGFKLIIISNQPNIGLKKISKENFDRVKAKMEQILFKKGIRLDEQYYCFHHPFAEIVFYRKKCSCRKPETGLYEKAVKKFDIDISKSWIIGDGVYDIIAGKRMALRTIFLANIFENEYLRILKDQLNSVEPDFLVKNLLSANEIIARYS